MSVSIFSNRLSWAGGEGFFCLNNLLCRLRLFENVGVIAFFLARERIRRDVTTQVTINASIVHVKSTRDVLGIFQMFISHNFPFTPLF
jgi:hypothetical protein